MLHTSGANLQDDSVQAGLDRVLLQADEGLPMQAAACPLLGQGASSF